MQVGEDRADEEGLWRRDGFVEGGGEVEECEEVGGGGLRGGGKAVVEQV